MPKTSTRVIPYQRNTASTPAQTAVGAGAGTILNANALRTGMVIQNTGTTIIYLSMGATAPTVTAYHVALAACTAGDDGKGGIYVDDTWTGIVKAIGSAGGGTVVITEILVED